MNSTNNERLNSTKLLSSVNAFVKRKYIKFGFYFDSEESFRKLIMSVIDNFNYDYDGTNSYVVYLKDEINHKVFSYIINKVYNGNFFGYKNICINNSLSIINQYLEEVYAKPILSKHEMNNLLMDASKGNNLAKNKVIESNLRLALYYSMNYLDYGVDFLEIIQEANMGLQKAVGNLDVSKIDKFPLYFKIEVCGAIINLFRKRTLDIIPLNEINKYSNDGELNSIEMLDSFEYFMKRSSLSSAEKKIITSAYGVYGDLPLSHSQIAEKYGYTYDTETTLYNNGLKKLKKRYNDIINDGKEVERQDFIDEEKQVLKNLTIYLPGTSMKSIKYALNRLSIDELKLVKSILTGKNMEGNFTGNSSNNTVDFQKKVFPKIKRLVKEHANVDNKVVKQCKK